MLSTTDSLVITAIGPVYTAALLVMVLINGRAFMQRKCLDLALEEREETVSLLLREYESSDADWLWQTNAKLCFQNVSARFARAIGRTDGRARRAVDRRPDQAGAARRPGRAARARRRRRRRSPGAEAFSELVVAIPVGDGIRSIELSARPTFNKQGRFTGYHGVGSDVTERPPGGRPDRPYGPPRRPDRPSQPPPADGGSRRRAQARRRRAAASARCCWSISTGSRRSTTSLGHVAGDHLLQQVSRSFETVISDEMTAGRLGGDEFAIVVPAGREPRASSSSSASPWSARCRGRSSTASSGCSSAPASASRSARATATRVEELIRNADLALYRAKDGGGQRHPLLRAGAPRPRRGAPQDRAGAARRDGRGRVQPRLPAGGRRRRRRDQELRGAAALAQSRARPDSADQVHPDRRGNRHARPDRRVGAAHRLPRGRDLARATSRSRSTSRRASCAIPAPARPGSAPRPG